VQYSKWVGSRLASHATGFEFFTRSARAQVVAADFLARVANGLALLFGGALAARDRRILLVLDLRTIFDA
jgi:hypothetical protein